MQERDREENILRFWKHTLTKCGLKGSQEGPNEIFHFSVDILLTKTNFQAENNSLK